MGCKQSTANQPAKSVLTDDTYIDEYNENFSTNQQDVDSSHKTPGNEDTMNSYIRNNNHKTAFGNSVNNNRSSVSNGYTSKGIQNVTRQPLTIIPSAQPVYRQQKPKPVPANTKNITDLVDLEEYGLPADDSDKLKTNFAAGGYAVNHSNSGNTSGRNNDFVNQTSRSNISEQKSVNSSNITSLKVSKPIGKIASPKTENITQVVDLEEYDSSKADNRINNSLSNMSIKSDDRRTQNSKIQNGHVRTKAMDTSKQNDVQPFTIISSNKSTYGAKRTMKSASSNTDHITQVVDLEEYDL